MKLAVVGVGAVGGYYGGLLTSAGLDVHFLLRSDYEHVRQHGLLVESVNGDLALPTVNAYQRPENMPRCDVVIVALKSTQNRLLSAILPHAVKRDGIVVVLQNGLGVEEEIARLVPDATVMGGLCFVCSNKVGPGHVRHLDYGLMTLGEYRPDYAPAGLTRRLERLAKVFQDAGIPIELSANLGEDRWRKLIWNVPFNGLTVVLDATSEEIIQCPPSRRLAEEIMLDVVAGAQACGYAVREADADRMLELTEGMIAYKPSMRLDYERGNRLETKAIYWAPIARAEGAGYRMATVRTLALQLDYLDARAGREVAL